MSTISIAGQRHAIKRAGLTLCGQEYRAWYQTSHGQISCPGCCRILEAERIEYDARCRAKEQRARETAGEDLPF